MKKYSILLASLFAGVILTGCNTITEVGQINGVTVTTHTKRGFFSPSFCNSYTHDPNKPGEIELRSTAANPGVLGEVAGAGGQVGAASLFRPSRHSTSVSVSQASDNDGVSTGNISVHPAVVPPSPVRNTPPSPPPGHVNSPSGNH